MYPLFNGDFRKGFIDRQGWSAPGEGEAYTYSKISDVDILPFAGIGILAPVEEFHLEVGLRAYWIRVSLEQGYDRFNMRDARRDATGKARAYSVYTLMGQHRGILFALDVGPFGDIDFAEFGKGTIKGFALFTGYSF